MTETNLKDELQKGLEKVEALVDDVKVRVHLAGMDAKDEWNKLEPRVTEELQGIKQDFNKVSKSALDELVGALEKLRAKL